MTMNTNNIENNNNNTVNDFVVVAQPVYLAVVTPEGVVEINTPDGENWYIVDPESRNATSIDIEDFANYEVVKYEYGELPGQPQPPVVVVDTYEYHGKKTDVFLTKETREDGEASALLVTQSAKNKKALLVTSEEEDSESSYFNLGYVTEYSTSAKQEENSLAVTRESGDGFFAEEITASSFTATRAKTTSFEVESYCESQWGEDDSWSSFQSLHATKEVTTASSTKWTSMEAVREYTDSSSSEYLWYSYDESMRTKRVVNAFEVFIDEEPEFGLSVYIEGNFNTWKYTGSGSEKEVEFWCDYSDGGYEQTFVIRESNSRKETVREVTRTYDGEYAEETVTTTVTDYRMEAETSEISSSIRYLEEEEAYGDFLEGVEFYTGHDVFWDIMKFEDESLGLVDSLQKEAWKLERDATELALTKGTQTQHIES